MKMMILLLFFFSLSALPGHVAKSSNYSDQHALMAFKDSLLLDPHNSLSDWSPNHTFCNWTGVICASRRQRVVSFNLTDNRLQGGIPAELGMLSQLNWLNLAINNLIGSIPIALSNCTHLQVLQLTLNHLNGPIPLEFGSAVRVAKIDFVGEPTQWRNTKLSG